ncbi:hypothetical protein ABZ667_42930 [Streptomyces lavendulae]|uniref:hypothetical protein n=1 Tax=Streptomyces lavendulae TaxID=1914 RepID=UPI0033F2C682
MTQRGHRTDAANNLRPYEANPYSIQARSKEREEKLLSQLVIINEKKTTLAEKIEKAGGNALLADADQLEEYGEKDDELRALIGDEHAIQMRATDAQTQEAPGTTQGSTAAPGELPLVTETAAAGNPPRADRPDRVRADGPQETDRERPADPDTKSAGEPSPGPLHPDAPDAARTDVVAQQPAARTQNEDAQAPPATDTPGATREADFWETAVRELTAGGLLDEGVITWARANDVTNLAIPLSRWIGDHLSDRWDDLDRDDWPEWVTQYFQVPAQTRKAVAARVAEGIHAAVHQQPAPPRGAFDSPDQNREMTVEEMVRHDAQAMASLLGSNAQVVTSDEFARLLGGLSSAAGEVEEPVLAADTDLWQEAVTAFTDAALADEALAIEARAQGHETFQLTFREWSDDWLVKRWKGADVRPAWVEAYIHPEAWETSGQLADQVATDIYARARQRAALPSETAARNQRTQPPEPHLRSFLQEALQEAADGATTLLASASLADSVVTRWAREAGPDLFAEKFAEWTEAWLIDLAGQSDADDLPMPIRFLLHWATRDQGERIAAAAAASVQAIAREATTDDPAPSADDAAPGAAVDTALADPEVEAVRRVWLQSKDWWVKTAAEGRSGQRLHLASTPGYVLVERTSKIAEGWEVVPAGGQRLKIGPYTGIAEWGPAEREHAEAFAAKLDQALRGPDGAPFSWPVRGKWRSTQGYKLDRAIAEVRAACDRERGIDSSPGIHQAAALADRDAQAQAAAEEKKAAAAAQRAEAKAERAAAGRPSSPDPGPAAPAPKASPDSPADAALPQAEGAASQAQADAPGQAPVASAPGEQAPTADADPTPPAEPASEQAPSLAGDREAPEAAGQAGQAAETELEEGHRVITPDGPGTVTTLYGDLALVSADNAGSRVWHTAQLQREDQPGVPTLRTAEIEKRQQNAADTDRAATPGGIPLYYEPYRRLRDLDIEAGHGTVVEGMTVDWDDNVHEAGEVVGWVRARMGDNGKRYWWAQDARGEPPDDMPFHESLPAKAGVPAIRAAGMLDTDRKPSSKSGHSQVITPPYAVREIKFTTAQVALLRTLPMVGTYPDGSDLPTPPWVGEHRRYVMSVAQMQALRVAAEAAADTCDTTTTIGRRSRKVLLNAADKLHFEEYETARRGASIPPIGEPDPYAGPYTPRPSRPEPDVAEGAAFPAEAKEAVFDNEQPDASPVQPAVPAPEQAAAQRPSAQAEETPVEEQDQAEIPGMADMFDPRSGSVPVDVPAPMRPEPAAAEDAPSAAPVVPTAGAVGSTAGDGPDDVAHGFAPQDRVFHDAMRYVVESVSPDGTVIRTIEGQDLPVAEAVAEADMPPVITEDLAEGWWRYTYEGRSYTATTLPPDLARAHPTAVLNTVIVDEEGALVGRAFGRPHESAIIWAHAHPGVPHPHVAEWLGTTPTPWPDHTPAEIEHVTAGPPSAEPDGYDEETDRPDAPSGGQGEGGDRAG